MNKTLFVVAVICLVQLQVLAQAEELPKFEVAGEFTTLEREAFPGRLTAFALDVGGVVEFYPSKRIVTRFDADPR